MVGAELMEVDFSAATKPFRPLPLLEVTGRDSSMYRGHDSKLPIQRLTLDNTKLAGEVIESFGVALGAKQGAFVVDALLSDVFEGWTNNNGPPSLVLLKEWTGSLYVATKVRRPFVPRVRLCWILTINKFIWKSHLSFVGVDWGLFSSFL
jgi:hypothetical protein